MSAHTPAPWTLGRTGRVVMSADGERIADCRNEDVGDEVLEAANARLIAAAPDLFAALKDAREELRLLREKDDCGPYDPTLKVRIDAAIAAAEVAP